MDKKSKLLAIVNCCQNRFNHQDVATWKHSDYVGLSREIQRDTNTSISPSTLKRIFGKVTVDNDYIPQQATLDALIKYGRYVESENTLPAPQIIIEIPPQPSPVVLLEPERKTGKSKRSTIILITLIVIIGIISLMTWRVLNTKAISGKIRIIRTEGHLPATTFFELQLPEVDDSLFINFGDKSPLAYINPVEKNAAHIYYIPGVFSVSIQNRQQIIATTKVFVRSDNWIGLVFHNQQEIPNHFYKFPAVKTDSDSLFQVTNNQLATMGLDTTGVILTRFCNYTPIAHNADNFVFETTFRNAIPEKSNYCRGTQFQVTGSNSMIRFKLVSSGCSLRVLNVVSEQTFSGATKDLSQFVVDLEKWNSVKLVNHNKQVSLYVNSKQIFSGTYQQPLGDVRGISLEFEGAGSVKSCNLKSIEGKTLYHF